MRTYLTSEVARQIGIHPNTVRLYEECQLIPKPERRSNGYRIFTDQHIEQLKLARTLLSIEVLQNGLRKIAIEIIKTAATGDFDLALQQTQIYLARVQTERRNAEEALNTVHQILEGETGDNAERGEYKALTQTRSGGLFECHHRHAAKLGTQRPAARETDGKQLPDLHPGRP